MKKKVSIVSAIAWILGWLVAYYFLLPPINVTSLSFWAFFTPAVFIPVLVFTQAYSLKGGLNKGKAFYPMMVVIVLILVFFAGILIVSPIFNANSYTKRIDVVTSSFDEDIQEVDFNNLPLLDKASTQKVGDRIVGQIADLVSQFSVSDEYTLINYQNKIVRVTPLEHNGFFKYLANLGGTAGYVIVDSTTGEATLVRLDDGLKYLPSAYFFNNLRRHVQINNPFDILGEFSFELDDDGNPYWIVQTLKYTWVGMKKEVNGIIVVNAVTGEMTKYKDLDSVPTWIDNVYDADLVTQEIDSWGMYQGGFLNSLFSQKNVVQATTGYTYITMDDDVYMYTGITSVSSDESNIGFVMVNLRTHEAKFYSVPGAEEYSAMDSAIGAVQEKDYTSTFPLLINLEGRPTYLLSLKDDAGLVKMYAFVDVQNYQKVTVTDASLGIEAAANAYLQMLGNTGYEEGDTQQASFGIAAISTVVIDGDTYYYLLSDDGGKYSVAANVNLAVTPYLTVGNRIACTYYPADDGVNSIISITLTSADDTDGGEQSVD